MSTKAIDEVLRAVRLGLMPDGGLAIAATSQMDAIKKACRVVDDFGVVHSLRFDESKEDDELNEAADFLCAIGRPEDEA